MDFNAVQSLWCITETSSVCGWISTTKHGAISLTLHVQYDARYASCLQFKIYMGAKLCTFLLHDTNTGTTPMTPMVTSSNNTQTKANSTRGLIISALQFGLHRQSVDSTDESSAIVAISGYIYIFINPGHMESVVWHTYLQATKLFSARYFCLYFIFCEWKSVDIFNGTLPQVNNLIK